MAGQTKLGNTSYTMIDPLSRMEGRTLGLMGFGRIARVVARKMSGFGLNIIAYDPMMDTAAAQQLNVSPVSFQELLAQSDYISIHCPLTQETHHLFDRQIFEQMKPTVIFINTARGAIVKEEDMVAFLREHEFAMAGIDVTETEPVPTDHPLLKLNNAVVTPHVAWYSVESVLSLQRKVAEEVAGVLSGQPPRHPVNHPVSK